MGSSPLDPYDSLIYSLVAQYGRTIDMDIYRPDYNAAGSEQVILQGVSMRIDTSGGGSQVQNKLPGVTYFIVAGPKDIIEPGDVLIPSSSDGSTPIVTVIQNIAMSDCNAFRSNRVGQIIDTTRIGNPTYLNVRFDKTASTGHTSPIIPEFEGSKEFETDRVVVYGRPNIKKGMRLVENGKRSHILAVAGTGNHLLLQLQGDPV